MGCGLYSLFLFHIYALLFTLHFSNALITPQVSLNIPVLKEEETDDELELIDEYVEEQLSNEKKDFKHTTPSTHHNISNSVEPGRGIYSNSQTKLIASRIDSSNSTSKRRKKNTFGQSCKPQSHYNLRKKTYFMVPRSEILFSSEKDKNCDIKEANSMKKRKRVKKKTKKKAKNGQKEIVLYIRKNELGQFVTSRPGDLNTFLKTKSIEVANPDNQPQKKKRFSQRLANLREKNCENASIRSSRSRKYKDRDQVCCKKTNKLFQKGRKKKQMKNNRKNSKAKKQKRSKRRKISKRIIPKTKKKTVMVNFPKGSYHRFGCSSCNYKTDTKNQMTIHIMRHNGDKPFSCNLCAYSSVENSHLIRHLKIHTGERPHKCTLCNYASIQKVSLDNHVKRVHAPFKLESCF